MGHWPPERAPEGTSHPSRWQPEGEKEEERRGKYDLVGSQNDGPSFCPHQTCLNGFTIVRLVCLLESN